LRRYGRVAAVTVAAAVAIGFGASPASAGTNFANFTRACGTNNGANQNFNPQSAAITSKVNGACSGTLGVQIKRSNGSLTGVQFGVPTGSGWLYVSGTIQGSYHYGCQSGCGGSWLVAL